MKNQALEERKSQRLQEKENFNKNQDTVQCLFFTLLKLIYNNKHKKQYIVK